ncbi:MAG: acetyl-CoA synthetase [Acidimicrobiia bacterium]
MSSTNDVKVCIVGTARHTWRTDDVAPEPLTMWEEVARAAIDDVGASRDVVAELDHLGVVHTQSWPYDDPVARLGARLGRDDLSGADSILAGTSPQRMLDEAAAAMVRGEISAALVVGAEAQATLQRLEKAGETPDWSFRDPAPVGVEAMLSEWYLPTEFRHGILPAWLTFALLGQARWAARGARATDRSLMFEQLAAISAVAAMSPYAWFPVAHSAERLSSTADGNRMVATPFTKLTTAFPFVDMAAANVMVTETVADRWGVPADRRVYLRGWGFARDASHIAARTDLASSPAMRAATSDAMAMAGVDRDEIDVFDLYSCFGTAVQFARDAIGLSDDDPRPVSLTGGLPFHGGPGSNYMGHSISAMVEHLRSGAATTAMVTGVGMHMTKHVAAVWSTDRGTTPLSSKSDPQRTVLDDGVEAPAVRDTAEGPVTIEAASAIYDRSGEPTSVVAICELTDGSRCYALSTEADVIAAVATDRWAGTPASVAPTDAGVNLLRL